MSLPARIQTVARYGSAAAGGTYVTDYEIPLNTGVDLVADVALSRAVANSSNLSATAKLRAFYTVQNKNGSVTAGTPIAASANPLDSDDVVAFVPETSDAAFINGATMPTAAWTIFGTSARLTITNPNLINDADVTVIIKATWWGSEGTFTPLDVPGIVGWYDAATATQVANRVSALPDQSGSGDANRDLLQSTGSMQPLWNATDAAYNNAPTVQSDDGLRWMESSTWGTAYAQPNTVYVCGEMAAGAAAVLVGGGLVNQHQIGRGPVYGYAGTLLIGTSDITTKTVICIVFNGATSKVYVNRYNTAEASGDIGALLLDSVTLFSYSGGLQPYFGKLAQAIYYSVAHDATDRKRLMRYLGNLCGITITA